MFPNDIFKKEIMVLTIIIIIGGLLRFIGADWGLPTRLHPDKGFVTGPAYGLAASHSFEAKIYLRPDHVSIIRQIR